MYGYALEQRLAEARPRSRRLTVEGRISSASMPNLVAQLVLPLLGQGGRAEHGEPLRLALREQFGGDEPGLDGLADADVVGDRAAGTVSWRRAISSGTSWYGRGSTAIAASERNGPRWT